MPPIRRDLATSCDARVPRIFREISAGEPKKYAKSAISRFDSDFVGTREGAAYHFVMDFERITIDPAKMGAVPCIRGLRIPVATVLGQLAAGRTETEIMEDFPDLEPEDIPAALEYAAAAVQGELPRTRTE